MNWLENKYLHLLSGNLRNFTRVDDRTYRFSCPLCGDSKKNKKKTRGYIYDKKGTTRFACHNCGRGRSFHRFLQEVDSYLYTEYQKERIVSGLWVPSGRASAQPKITQDHQPANDKGPVLVDITPDDPLRFLKRIDRLSEDHYARKYCVARMLPDLTRVYHCPGFYAWSNYVIPKKFDTELCDPKRDHPRLVIPFYDKDGEMFAFQGRAYKDSDVKYITLKIDESKPKVYGLDTVDFNETVFAFEGPIDSMFIPNSIAFAGGGVETLRDLDPGMITVVFDNEPRSPHTKKKMLLAIESGFSVCVWPKEISESDVNKMVLAGVKPDIIRQIIIDSTHRGLMAEAEVSLWSKA